MGNLVSLEIRATDLTGPAFLSVLARAEALKKALQDAGNIDVNASGIDATLSAVKSKLQAHGIADLLDVNLSQGQISAQLMMLKRRISDAKIGDLLDVNLNAAAAQAQIARLAHDIESARIPLTITPYVNAPLDMSRVTWSPDAVAGLAAAAGMAGTEFGVLTERVAAAEAELAGLTAGMDELRTHEILAAIPELQNFNQALIHIDEDLAALSGDGAVAGAALGGIEKELVSAGLALDNFHAMMPQVLRDLAALAAADAAAKAAGTPVAAGPAAGAAAGAAAGKGGGAGGGILGGLVSGAGWRGFLPTGNASLFGGMFGTTPILGAIGAVHLLTEMIIEFAAVAIPAGVAFGVFGVAAIPTLQEIYQQMTALKTVTTAFSNTQYPLAGGFTALADAARPAVLQLWGDALVVAGAKQGAFMTLVKQTGPVLDQLGNRTAAALQGNGLGAFFKNGAADLARFGDMAGNVFGTIGNLLKTMPGYAEILLTAFDDLTKGLEAVSASPVTQWIIGAGLAVHGFAIWAGLAVTGVVILGNALGWLAGKAGLTGLAMGAFNGAAFKAQMVDMGVAAEAAGVNILSIGASMIQSGINTVFGTSLGATAMQKEAVAAAELAVAQATAAGDAAGLAVAEGVLAAASDAAGASISALDGVMAVFDAITPMGWVLIAGAALAGLVYWLTRAGSATTQYTDSVKTAFQNAPVSTFTTTMLQQQSLLTSQLADATSKLGTIREYQTNAGARTGAGVKTLTQAYQDQLSTIAGIRNAQVLAAQGQSNYNMLLKTAGGNQAILNNAGLTSQQILTDTGQKLAQDKIAVMAATDAWKSMSLGVGQNSAAMNALTSEFMNSTLPALQKVTQAEDAVMTVILGGEQAFIGFQQSLATMATDAKVAGASLGGLSTASLTLSSDFYTTSVPAMQKVIDTLQQQQVSQGDLTKIIADGSAQLNTFAQGNSTAQQVIVDMINNALGPGTVSLKTLNKWIGNNATSLSDPATGFNALVAQATANVSKLTIALTNQLAPAFQTALLKASGADSAINTLAADLVTSGGQITGPVHGAMVTLYNDLLKAGIPPQQDKQFVDGLVSSLGKVPPNTVANVDLVGSASGSGYYSVQIGGQNLNAGQILFKATGGLVGGSYGTDQNLAMLTRDEIVFPAWAKEIASPLARKLGLPGFASGGLVGPSAVTGPGIPWMQGAETGFGLAGMKEWANAATAQLVRLSQANLAAVSGTTANTGGSAVAALAQQMAAARGWTGGQWLALNSVEMAEAGWNLNATNPGSGAYGIAQFINGPSEYYQYGGNPNTAAGQVTGFLNYVAARYGTPAAAWGHEMAYGWYDSGGWLQPGLSMAYNGTGQPERVSPPGGGAITLEIAGGSQTAFDQFMLNWLRKTVRVKGGGSVQNALGRNG